MIVTALGLPVTGRLTDLYGPRPVLLVSIALTAIGLFPMAFVNHPWEALVLYGLIFAVGSAGTSVTPIAVMVTRAFPNRTGLANSIAISGMGLGQLIIVMVLANRLGAIGWRGSFMLLAAMNFFVLLPLIVAMVRAEPKSPVSGDDQQCAPEHPLDRAARPDGDAIEAESSGTMRFAASRQLWLLGAMYAICGIQDFFTATHVVAYALDRGVSDTFAGNLLAFMGLAGLAGVLAAGAMADRKGPVWPTMICFVVRVLIFGLVSLDPGAVGIAVFALAYGATFWVTAPLTVVFVRTLFGVEAIGTLTGVVTMVHHMGGGLGAFVGAAIFDARGSYTWAFVLMMLLSLIACVLTAFIRPGHDRRTPSAPESGVSDDTTPRRQ
jgi:predicted MFS family arabinose efflux permease